MKVYKAALVCAGLAIGLGYQAINGQAPARGPAQAGNAQVIERGRYIVEIGGCNDCHTAGYAEKDGQAPEADRLKGDVLGYRGPWGTTYPTNLRLTFSKLTEDAWVKYAKGLKTRPPMPWFNVARMTEADLKAMYQYIKSIPGNVGTAAPPYLAPDKQPKQPYIQWPSAK